jgi:methionyl-tRNA synthetase
MKKPYYITTAIAYTSGKPHLGNVYEIVLADAIARFKREEGYDVYFQTGTDEHGQKIEGKAKENNQTPKEYVDQVASQIKDIFDMMNTSYDHFIRTTDEYHEKQVQKIFKKLYEKGDIYKDIYEGWYCTPCESFFTDAQVVDGKCPDCHGDVHREKEESYFFKLSKYQHQLMEHIEKNPEFIQPPSRKNEMVNNFLKPGLQDLAVSRTSFKWGIPVDFDPEHVVYVWIDALSNYITGLGYDVEGKHHELFNKYWPADVHLIGKDILRFHTLYWPIMLMALEVELPKQVFGHPWLLVGEGKMSKSKGNVMYSDQLVELFGVDAVRYIMLREMPFAQDGNVTLNSMIERINSDLVNILGNLVNRTWAMSMKYFEGNTCEPVQQEVTDEELIVQAKACHPTIIKQMENLRVADALETIISLCKRANKYIDETTPWALAKEESDKPRLQTVLYNLLETIRICGVALKAFIPETSDKIATILNTKEVQLQNGQTFGLLEKNNSLHIENIILFDRINMKEANDKYNELVNPTVEEEITYATIDDFSKLTLKVGEVLECKKHPNANKLLVSQIDCKDKVHQVVSGIADFMEPEAMIGKKVIVITNLQPIKIRDVLSEGMLLVAENKKQNEVIEVLNLPKGSIVR